MDGAEPGVHDSVVLTRFLLGAASAAGADAHRLAEDLQLPRWALAAEHALLPSRYSYRLWELLDHAVQVPDIPLAIADRHRPGQLDLYDYLFTTALTAREGFQANNDFLHLVTTNGRMRIDEGDGETTISYWHVEGAGRGEELCLQFAVAVFCARARAATGHDIAPAHVTFAHPAPRSHGRLIESLGMRNIDFGAPVTTVSFRTSDLDLPFRGADPVLGHILRRYAETLPPPPQVTWYVQFQQRLDEVIVAGEPSLQVVARQMFVSTRTLQRQLAEHGTTWRAELDAARLRLARQASARNMTSLAHRLGYSGERSLRRAMRRWETTPPDAGV